MMDDDDARPGPRPDMAWKRVAPETRSMTWKSAAPETRRKAAGRLRSPEGPSGSRRCLNWRRRLGLSLGPRFLVVVGLGKPHPGSHMIVALRI